MEAESATNWDHGHLTRAEVLGILSRFLDASGGVAGMDVVGDWSPVETSGLMRKLLHWTEHDRKDMDADRARRLNEPFNLALVEALRGAKRPLRLAC